MRRGGAVADPGGGVSGPPPPKIESTMFSDSFVFFFIMLKNKVQIARESIKTTLELPGPFSEPWTPAESEFGPAIVMCARAHKLLRPPPLKILDPPLAADCLKRKVIKLRSFLSGWIISLHRANRR